MFSCGNAICSEWPAYNEVFWQALCFLFMGISCQWKSAKMQVHQIQIFIFYWWKMLRWLYGDSVATLTVMNEVFCSSYEYITGIITADIMWFNVNESETQLLHCVRSFAPKRCAPQIIFVHCMQYFKVKKSQFLKVSGFLAGYNFKLKMKMYVLRSTAFQNYSQYSTYKCFAKLLE